MKLRHSIILFSAMITIMFLVAACSGEDEKPSKKCPTCPNSNSWSECSDDAIRLKLSYKCSSETNYSCEAYNETKPCDTVMDLKGAMKDSDILISPTLDDNVKGIIKVEAKSVPEVTKYVEFILMPQDVQLGGQMPEEDLARIVKEVDNNGKDGWKAYFDTNKTENGLYKVFIGIAYEGSSKESPWIDYVQAQVIVKN